MTKQPFRFYSFFLLICFSISVTATAQTVNIPDPNFRAEIEEALDKPSGATITRADMAALTRLVAQHANIRNLTGLEHATNLTILDLGVDPITFINSNSIQDISPLAGLTKLTQLRLEANNISDISPLARLNNLETLELWGNSISDISSLSGLTNLRELLLIENSISDISAVAGLTNLTELLLGHNSISDISAVAGLTNLTVLELMNNFISDISAVAGLTNLRWLRLSSNSISDISSLSGLTNLRWLGLSSNSISDISPLVANTGLGTGDEVNVTENPLNTASINTHIPALQRRGVTVRFDAVVIDRVNIPDPNLRAIVENALGRTSGATITAADMANFTTANLRNSNIRDLTGLEYATNLEVLALGAEQVAEGVYINSNSIRDISPLAGLTNLTRLGLRDNSISDISALSQLTNLTVLDLRFNPITDISALSGLTNLITLFLVGNNISDISALSGLTNLRELLLIGNSISDISVLSRLTNLTVLGLDFNSISDISSLSELTNLTRLALSSNNISDISALSGLTNLEYLMLTTNSISDISPLAANKGLGTGDEVHVTENPLNHASINDHIPALQSRRVEVYFDDTVAQPEDVNGDGVVNIFDLVSVASQFGTQGQNLPADVNGDGVVNILDLVLVAGMFGEVAAAPSAHPQAPETLTAAEVRQWLTDAKALEVRGPIMKWGVVVLKQLLAALTPIETELLANYPNPFNPETWIPYRLAEDAFVTLTIYDRNGQIVRTIDVGHQIAAVYEGRSKAVYWDGRNGLGEGVASGVYFYHLSAGEFSAHTEDGDSQVARSYAVKKPLIVRGFVAD